MHHFSINQKTKIRRLICLFLNTRIIMYIKVILFFILCIIGLSVFLIYVNFYDKPLAIDEPKVDTDSPTSDGKCDTPEKPLVNEEEPEIKKEKPKRRKCIKYKKTECPVCPVCPECPNSTINYDQEEWIPVKSSSCKI